MKNPKTVYRHIQSLLGKSYDNPQVALYQKRFSEHLLQKDPVRETAVFKNSEWAAVFASWFITQSSSCDVLTCLFSSRVPPIRACYWSDSAPCQGAAPCFSLLQCRPSAQFTTCPCLCSSLQRNGVHAWGAPGDDAQLLPRPGSGLCRSVNPTERAKPFNMGEFEENIGLFLFFPYLNLSLFYRTANQRRGDYCPRLLQPGRAPLRAAGGSDGWTQSSSAHQRQHCCGRQLRGVQEEGHRQHGQGTVKTTFMCLTWSFWSSWTQDCPTLTSNSWQALQSWQLHVLHIIE